MGYVALDGGLVAIQMKWQRVTHSTKLLQNIITFELKLIHGSQ